MFYFGVHVGTWSRDGPVQMSYISQPVTTIKATRKGGFNCDTGYSGNSGNSGCSGYSGISKYELVACALGSRVADFQSVGTTEFLLDIRDDTHSGLFVRLDGDGHKTLLGLFH